MVWGVVYGVFIPVMFWYSVQVGSYWIYHLVLKFFQTIYYIIVCDAYFQMSGELIKEVDNCILIFFWCFFCVDFIRVVDMSIVLLIYWKLYRRKTMIFILFSIVRAVL